jgi:RimJ/RimL family protein N-acetyltransferase
MFPDELAGDGLRLRSLELLDLEPLFAYLSRPEVYEPTSADPWTRDAVLQFITSNRDGMAQGRFCRYAILEGHAARAVGDIGFGSIDEAHRRLEIGYHLSPEAWGQGLTTRAARLLIDWAFRTGFNRIEATVMQGNARSERVLQRLGFTREATLRQYKLVRGQFRDFSLWSLLNSDVA